MRRSLLALPLLFVCLCVPAAQDAPPVLPKSAKGFDEGREGILREAAGNPFESAKLVERLFEEADLAELALFCSKHLRTDEKAQLDKYLELKGALSATSDAASALAVLVAAKLKPAQVSAAVGKVVAGQQVKLTEAVSWLYIRGFNFNVLQRAMNGERIDSIRLRRQLREHAVNGKGMDVLFGAAHWEFNLKDGREEKGGHYDGAQVVEGLLALGWTEQTFAAAFKKQFPRGLSDRQRMLIGWGDPVLAWHAISQGLAESELIEGVLSYLRAQPKTAADDARVLQVALTRGRILDRWFRTGGVGVVGVWTGPLPASNGEPKAPRESAELVADADADQFAAALNDPIRNHFNNPKADTLTVVAYSDGSTRMIVNRPGRPALKYSANTPASGTSTMQMYEGRFSVEGRIAYATLAFGQGQTIAPPEVDMVNVRQLAKGALLSADLDDGVTLTPLLLRRASRLIDAP